MWDSLNMENAITLLPNTHVSPDTAYVVADYPYSWKLRCQIRYWLDVHPKRGVRCMSQTSNPKVAGLLWNKPKASTYSRFAGALYLDGEGHVQHAGLSEYTNGQEAAAWRDTYGAAVPEAARQKLNDWVAVKLAYDAARDAGETMSGAAAKAAIQIARDGAV